MKCRKAGIKSTTLPQICCRTTLRNLNVKLRNFTARYPMQVRCKIVIYRIYLPDMLSSVSYVYADIFKILQNVLKN